ncbi:MAG: HAD family hydrolase [Bacteroidota bacterium]
MIDTKWSLFLDRDGVLNKRIVDGYVTQWNEFLWLPGVPEALKILSRILGPVVVVSNQQGVGKGIMTEQTVTEIHNRLLNEVAKDGGRIDAIYFSPHLEKEQSFMRKPNVGMGLKARKEFPAIRFKQAVMAGDTLSDMLFGRRLGMKTIFLSENKSHLHKGHKLIDFAFPNLLTFAKSVLSSQSSVFSLQSPGNSSPPHHSTTSLQ